MFTATVIKVRKMEKWIEIEEGALWDLEYQ